MARNGGWTIGSDREEGQAALLMLGMLAVLLAGVLVLFGFGQALGAKGHTQRAADLARHSLGEARRSVQNLSPVALEHDTLPEALRKTVADWSERTGITARFTVTGTAEPLHDEVAATLLRIAQEALANAERHSGASRAGVTLSYMGDEITLDVRDDGRGFDPSCIADDRHGLVGMRERVGMIGGSLKVGGGPDGGTRVEVTVPLGGLQGG